MGVGVCVGGGGFRPPLDRYMMFCVLVLSVNFSFVIISLRKRERELIAFL